MDILNLAWNAVGPAGDTGGRRKPWLQRWSGIFAAAALMALLLAYQTVVSGSVLAGQSRRVAVAAQAQATWRCKALADAHLREACLLELTAPGRATPPDAGATVAIGTK